jgi:mannose-6-phosphate isomerase-like protein (cupin superfamily)
MKRRSFLKTAAAILPAASLQEFALARAAAASPSAAVHVVGPGEDGFGEKHSLGFSNILFKVGTSETGGGLFIIEHTNLQKGGPPLHMHYRQDEWFYIMEGEVAFQVGDERKRLGPGESVLAPRLIPHAFSAAGQVPSHMIIAYTPAGMMEQFFRDTAHPNPPALDEALFRKYEMKYVGPSPFES